MIDSSGARRSLLAATVLLLVGTSGCERDLLYEGPALDLNAPHGETDDDGMRDERYPDDSPVLRGVAAWVDDYRAVGIDDCEHDAIISDILNYAIAPYLPSWQDTIVEWQVRAPVGECGEASNPDNYPRLGDMMRYELLFWNVGGSYLSGLAEVAMTTGKPPARSQNMFGVAAT